MPGTKLFDAWHQAIRCLAPSYSMPGTELAPSYDRYHIVSETDLCEAAKRLEAYAQSQQAAADGYKTVAIVAFEPKGIEDVGR